MSESAGATRTATTTARANEGVEGNGRLTSATGMVLLVMLAVEGYTILDVRGLITLHIFLGVMLVGPVLLKVAATMYRFGRYYTGASAYVRKGPPHPVLRMLGPLVTVTSLAVLGTGIGLIFVNSRGLLLLAHKASFVVWFAVMTVHVLGHISEAVSASWLDLRRTSAAGRIWLAALGLAVVLGVGGAAAIMPSASHWTNRSSEFDHGSHGR
jgi:hypothetical protein